MSANSSNSDTAYIIMLIYIFFFLIDVEVTFLENVTESFIEFVLQDPVTE